jgi:hypothetical protein
LVDGGHDCFCVFEVGCKELRGDGPVGIFAAVSADGQPVWSMTLRSSLKLLSLGETGLSVLTVGRDSRGRPG